MSPSRAIVLAGVLLALPLHAQQRITPRLTPPRVALVPHGVGVPVAPVRDRVEAALRDDGAVLVPTEELRAAARQMGVPATQLAAPPHAEQAADRLKAAALVDLEVARRSPKATPSAPFEARVRVVGADGTVRLESRVPLAGRTPTPDEARAIAALTVQATSALPPPVDPNTAPTAQSSRPAAPPAAAPGLPGEAEPPPPLIPMPQDESIPPAQPPRPLNTPVVEPKPSTLSLWELSALPTLTWGNASTTPQAPLPPLVFDTGKPYAGMQLSGDFFPLPGGVGRYLGFGFSYAFSALRVGITGPTGGVSRQQATEHRALGDLIGRFPDPLLGGQLQLRLGFAYEGFLTDRLGSLVTETHTSPHLQLRYRYPLPKSLEIEGMAGIRPWSFAGRDLTNTFGQNDWSFGTEAGLSLSGQLPALPQGLRWQAGYDYLRFDDRFGVNDVVRHQESYHRILLGVTWRRDRQAP